MQAATGKIQQELEIELQNILSYWREYSIDEAHGGFVGKRDHYNKLVENANKGIILNTRLLWSFAAACNFNDDSRLKTLADRAYEYLEAHFYDKVNKGFFWEVDYLGSPVNKRKQIYAQAFSIYSYAEYFKLFGDEQARERALETFSLIEKNARDLKENGYFEAFQEDWSPIEDVRLSAKDQNAPKTMLPLQFFIMKGGSMLSVETLNILFSIYLS